MLLSAYRALLDQLATLLAGGVPILDSLEGLRSSPHGAVARAAASLLPAIRAGRSLAEAMAEAGAGIFPPAHAAVVGAGERAGALPRILLRLRDETDRRIESRQALLRKLVRPVAILSLAAVLAPVSFIVEGRMAAYVGLQAAIFGCSGALIALGWFYRKRLFPLVAGLPLVGSALRRAALGEALSLLGLLVGAGIGVREALHIVAEAARRPDLAGALRAAAGRLDAGRDLAGALGPLLGSEAAQLSIITTGEKAGDMDRALESAGHSIELSAAQNLRRILLAIPMVLLGITFAVVVLLYIRTVLNYMNQFEGIR